MMAPVVGCRSARWSGSHHAIEGAQMPTALARLPGAIALSLIALLLSGSIVHAQRTGEARAAIYQIDPQTSDIRLLVYRDGALSTFGHNHIVSSKDFTGRIYLHPQLEQSRLELDFPVGPLIVDDPALRRQEGADFPNQPAKNDIEATLANMLSDALLNAKQVPTIKVIGTAGPVDAANAAMLDLTVQIAGRQVKLTLPCKLKLEGDQLEASGAAELSHKQLGLK